MQFTLTALWAHLGLFARLIVVVTGCMSLASLLVMAERVVVLRRSAGESRGFARRMADLLSSGNLDDVADQTLGANVGHLGRVIGAGLTAYRVNRGASKEVR